MVIDVQVQLDRLSNQVVAKVIKRLKAAKNAQSALVLVNP